MDDEWVPDSYTDDEEEEENIDIDEVKKVLIEKVQNVKQKLGENYNIDISKTNLKYMKNDIKLKNYQVIECLNNKSISKIFNIIFINNNSIILL